MFTPEKPFLPVPPAKRQKVGVRERSVVQPVPVKNDPPQLLDHSMQRFVEEYFEKHSVTDQIPSHTEVMLRHRHRITTGNANVTLFSGGSFLIPKSEWSRYFHLRAQDAREGAHSTVNEIQHGMLVKLALELDYRFPNIQLCPPVSVLETHVLEVYKCVSSYFDDPLTLYVLRALPKPKKVGQGWVVAWGMHLVFDRNVTMEDGAQISHGVAQHLLALDPRYSVTLTGESVVDNLYLDKNNLKKQISLRPPYSCKQEDCFYCNVHEAKGEYKARDCPVCSSWGRVIVDNVYKLRGIMINGKYNEEKCQYFTEHLHELLANVSVWDTRQPLASVNYERVRKYTMKEMCSGYMAGTTEVSKKYIADNMARTVQGKKMNVRQLLQNLGVPRKSMVVKKNTLPYRVIKVDKLLSDSIMALIIQCHTAYQGCRVSHLCLYYRQGLLIDVYGEGSRWCMHKGEFHSSNRARFILTNRQLWVGCFSERCPVEYQEVKGVKGGECQFIMDIMRQML
jgi:hypothetical protein